MARHATASAVADNAQKFLSDFAAYRAGNASGAAGKGTYVIDLAKRRWNAERLGRRLAAQGITVLRRNGSASLCGKSYPAGYLAVPQAQPAALPGRGHVVDDEPGGRRRQGESDRAGAKLEDRAADLFDRLVEVVDDLLALPLDDVIQTEGANDRGQLPLVCAVFKQDAESARLLLAAGADPDAGTPTARETAQMTGSAELLALLDGAAGEPR